MICASDIKSVFCQSTSVKAQVHCNLLDCLFVELAVILTLYLNFDLNSRMQRISVVRFRLHTINCSMKRRVHHHVNASEMANLLCTQF